MKRPVAPAKKQLLERLRAIEGELLWIGPSFGYGSDGGISYLSASGVTDYGSLVAGDITTPLNSPLSAADVKEAKKHIRNKTEGECDREILDMVRQGCVAGIKYHQLEIGGGVKYGTMKELIEEVCYIKSEYEEPTRTAWSRMSKAALAGWCEVLDWTQRGYCSWYDLPDDFRRHAGVDDTE